jgi:hypothetical protein
MTDTKNERAKKKQEAQAPQTPEEFFRSLMGLTVGPFLLAKIQSSETTPEEIQEELARRDAEAIESIQGQRLHSRYMFASFLGTRDQTANELMAELEYLELIGDQMTKDGLAWDRLECLIVTANIELKLMALCKHVAKQYPEEMRDLVAAMLSAIGAVMRGRLVRVQQEKGSDLTKEGRKKLIETSRKSIGESLPMIVDDLFPQEFEDYATRIFSDERAYEEAAEIYHKLWIVKHGKKRVDQIEAPIVRDVMEQLDIKKEDYRKVRTGIRQELVWAKLWKFAR